MKKYLLFILSKNGRSNEYEYEDRKKAFTMFNYFSKSGRFDIVSLSILDLDDLENNGKILKEYRI